MPNNRRRGSAGEREAGHALAKREWRNTERLLGQARDGGCDLAPISPDSLQYAVEVKRRKRVALLYEALEQAKKRDGIPMVMLRADGKPWLVIQTLDAWDVGR